VTADRKRLSLAGCSTTAWYVEFWVMLEDGCEDVCEDGCEDGAGLAVTACVSVAVTACVSVAVAACASVAMRACARLCVVAGEVVVVGRRHLLGREATFEAVW